MRRSRSWRVGLLSSRSLAERPGEEGGKGEVRELPGAAASDGASLPTAEVTADEEPEGRGACRKTDSPDTTLWDRFRRRSLISVPVCVCVYVCVCVHARSFL